MDKGQGVLSTHITSIWISVRITLFFSIGENPSGRGWDILLDKWRLVKGGLSSSRKAKGT
ncbi:MAG: hypothetical protein ACLVAW_19250 [Eisenbergiella massiliensis]